MGLLVAFGDDANFLLSVGGFHPSFTPPPLPFPSPEADLDRHPERGRRAHPRRDATSPSRPTPCSSARTPSCTSATARSASRGTSGFDALLRFSPFYFIVQVSALGLAEGFRRRRLQRPARRHARGPDAVAHPRQRLGEPPVLLRLGATSTAPGASRADVIAAAARGARPARAPSSASARAGMRSCRRAEPAARHAARPRRRSRDARAAPARIAAGEPESRAARARHRRVWARNGRRTRTASRSAVAGGGLARAGDADERFAPAQFLDLDDAAKLSRPPSRPMHGGHLARRAGPVARLRTCGHAGRALRGDRRRHRTTGASRVASRGSPACSSSTSCAATRAARRRCPDGGRDERVPFARRGRVGDGGSSSRPPPTTAPSAPRLRAATRRRATTSPPIAADPGLAGELHVIPLRGGRRQ